MIPMLMVCIGIVKEGTFDEFAGGESIGEVFGMFFDEAKWDARTVGPLHCVSFTGKALFDEKDSDYVFLFLVKPDEGQFRLEGVTVNGTCLSDSEVGYLLDDIYYAFEGNYPPEKATPDMTDAELTAALEDCEDLVRTGSFDGYEQITVEDALEDFFEDGKFRALVGVDDAMYVDYTGIADYRGVRSEFVFQFAIDQGRESFVLASLEINGRALPDAELDAVLEDILNSYRG